MAKLLPKKKREIPSSAVTTDMFIIQQQTVDHFDGNLIEKFKMVLYNSHWSSRGYIRILFRITEKTKAKQLYL